jgi:PiT family inorganic phosphate transporter
MTDTALQAPPIEPAARSSRPNLDKGFNPLTLILFLGVMAAGLLYVVYSVYSDVEATGTKITTYVPYLMLLVALLIALGFEFVNGFHDTANAVATVIYTIRCRPRWRSSGRVCSTSWACSPRPAPSPSASSRCCRSS